MILRDDDRPIRIRPGKPRVPRREGSAWAGAYRLVMHYVRGMRQRGNGLGAVAGTGNKPYRQRCAARVTYLNNRTRGQWKAHGRYLARESATADHDNAAGFNRDCSDLDIARELERWQSSGDPRMWKVILSPEFGDNIDLTRFTRNVVAQMAVDLGTRLEWLAVAHYNTEHPHVHMVIRGVREDGQPLQFRREYLKQGIREVAEDHCTRQLGYRTIQAAADAERREIGEHRFTSLDRAILQKAVLDGQTSGSANLKVVMNPSEAGLRDSGLRHARHVAARLVALQQMGLAASVGPNTWDVSPDLEEVLRAMQRAADRQKTLAAHGVPVSDHRLPTAILDLEKFTAVEGRILVHGQDERTGGSYLMLEGTDAKLHFIPYSPEMEVLRAQGGLRTNSFLRLRRLGAPGEPIIEVQDLGDSEKVLKNRALLREKAKALIKRGIVPSEGSWGGWLGRYEAAVAAVAGELLTNRERPNVRSQERKRDLGR